MYCISLCTQTPGLREIDLQSSPKRGSDKIDRLRGITKNTTENKLYRTAWANESTKLREVDLEHSVKGGMLELKYKFFVFYQNLIIKSIQWQCNKLNWIN